MANMLEHRGGTDSAAVPLPDTGERVPAISWPIVGIFGLGIGTFGVSAWAALTGALPSVATIALSAASIFVLFTVLHDASHYSISTRRWVNVAFGRVAMFFVSPLISFKSFSFIHISHHRNTNDGASDPDHFISGSPRWQLPFRFPAMDLPYVGFVLRNIKRRPRGEMIETFGLAALAVACIVGATMTGHLWTLAVVYLIPERVAMFVLAWWFDWLPHHDLPDTQRENRYRATRNRVGGEWVLTPLLLSQNYHLVHHLHPSIPFYRYVAAWRKNEQAYLDRDAALITAFGKELDAGSYDEWKRLNGQLAPLLPLRVPAGSTATKATAHTIPVAEVRHLTADSIELTLDVPADLRDQFAFRPGQHITIRHTVGGEQIRRNYSLCTPAASGDIAIAVRRVPGGVFSNYAVESLSAGDSLEVMTPTGNFGPQLDELARDHIVAVAGGSGITPILSIVRTALAIQTETRCTLFYGNRSADTTMFLDELRDLEYRYADRLRVVHIRSAEQNHPADLRGRIDIDLITELLREDLRSVDSWFLCGPAEMTTTLYGSLIEQGVPDDRVDIELFHGVQRSGDPDGGTAATATVTLSGIDHEVEVASGDSILEASLRGGLDAPYACMGGACGTCTAKVVSGTATMDQNFTLDRGQVEAGYVLTCQARPTSSSLCVDYD
ncbi:fatty acid desaturase [Gordonia sp. HY002]|uniref:fatty acid desaturase n=1 Tax=Gordonia zhenghanii TaxID=2911516 RepID=UPI001EF12CCF|nr:fatty acid desaturase [Gordonia zhenghanii]MCF8569176.1 fatty acid desaturase [Gordonia zhenghanii]MCF8604576.1 fatty acid desaturase [Gordonia zhenghanii]